MIELRNDGAGFGFGISGSRNSGAVVRNIFPGGAADREGHLRNGDHLLQVGDVRLWGMGAQQVGPNRNRVIFYSFFICIFAIITRIGDCPFLENALK